MITFFKMFSSNIHLIEFIPYSKKGHERRYRLKKGIIFGCFGLFVRKDKLLTVKKSRAGYMNVFSRFHGSTGYSETEIEPQIKLITCFKCRGRPQVKKCDIAYISLHFQIKHRLNCTLRIDDLEKNLN